MITIIFVLALLDKIQNPENVTDFIKWMIGLYIAGDVGEKFVTNKK